MTYANGDFYEGTFYKGQRSGKGIQTYSDGNKFEGMWDNDERKKGQGVMYYNNGDNYVGEFNDTGLRDGQGKMIYKSGEEYTGSWREGMKYGFGTQQESDSTRYEGQWALDKYNGVGEMRYVVRQAGMLTTFQKWKR